MGTAISQLEREYREFLRSSLWYAHANEGNAAELAYLTLGLGGESGEFEDAVKKIVRNTGFDNPAMFSSALYEPETREALISELGDVVYYVTRLADVLGLSVADLMQYNTLKLYNRIMRSPEIQSKLHDGGVVFRWPFERARNSHDAVSRRHQLEIGL